MDDSELAWRTLGSETEYTCPGFDVVRDDVRLPDGTETEFHSVSEPPSVVVLPFTDEGDVVSGDVLYPIAHTGTDTAIVMGHTGCGAVTATYDDLTTGLDEPAGITHCLDLLKSRLAPAVDLLPDDVGRPGAINRLVEYNVDRQIQFLQESGDVPDDVDCIGVVYDFQDVYTERRGAVHVVNVDGDTDPDALREAHPEIADRIRRRWTY